MKQTSKILKSDPQAQGPYGAGWGIGKSAISERIKEMRMDPRNRIQANFKKKGGKPSEENRWYKVMLWLKEYAERYEERNRFKISIRTAFYDAVDLKIVKDHEYNAFVINAADARIGYTDQDGNLLLPEIPMDAFADDSRILEDDYDDSDPTEVEEPGDVPDSNEYIDDAISELKYAPSGYDGKGSEGSPGEKGGRWYGQPEYVEVWEEKNDLIPGFRQILKGLKVKLRGNHGYSSFTFLYQCTEELKEIIDRKEMDQDDVYILYCGDQDPSGDNIWYYLERRLAQLGLTGIHIIKVAVTPEQIVKYKLPLLPVEKKVNKKKADANMNEYLRRFGKKASHLNAFFTEANLPKFTKILRDAVNEHWYQEIYDTMLEVYELDPDDPPRLTDEELSKRRRNQYRKITKFFNIPDWCSGLTDAPNPDEMDDEEEEDDDAVIYPGIDE